MRRLIVTLDGPAGSGKSTVARRLAKRLGLDFLDTGAMYRGITAKAVDRGIDVVEEDYAVVELARNAKIHFDWDNDPPSLIINEIDVTPRLRDSDVVSRVSDVAAMSAVRDVLVKAQRRIGEAHPGLVTEGRDQGSVVFPDAAVKFYLDASPQVRAERRANQLRELGKHVDLESIRESIVLRDRKDSSRKTAPLVCPEDAERIDTSGMSLDDVLDYVEKRVRESPAFQQNEDAGSMPGGSAEDIPRVGGEA
ncbi:MAG: (d)CMP kinase [Planctomycetota bacterium]